MGSARWKGKAMIFRQDERLTDRAERIREKCHGERLKDFQILYVFRDEHAVSDGKPQLGRTTRPGALLKFLCERAFSFKPDFLIEIAEDLWGELEREEQDALLDHELAHCDYRETKQGDRRPRLRGHDVEEFSEVLRRRGAWKPELLHFIHTSKQMPLFPRRGEAEKDRKTAAAGS